MTDVRRTKFYLDRANRKYKGVCAGIADYTGFDVTLVRVATVLLTLMGGFPWTVIAYFVFVYACKDKPRELRQDTAEETKFWQGVRVSPARSVRDVRSSFRDLDRRLAEIETHVTSGNMSLANEIEKLR